MSLQRLPTEINVHLVSFLNDKDIATFSSVCRVTHDAVACDHSPLWRSKFSQEFDLPPQASNNVLRSCYQKRKSILRRGASFEKGLRPREMESLEVLRDLIVNGAERQASNNMDRLREFHHKHGVLENVLFRKHFDKQTSPLLITIQVVLSHFRLDLGIPTLTFAFLDSQRACYDLARDWPMFVGRRRTEINMRWTLHVVNFFKYHLTSRGAALWDGYNYLSHSERPRGWRKRPINGIHKLGKRWRGCYAYLDRDELTPMRRRSGRSLVEDRWIDNSDGLCSLSIDSESNPPWPNLFERTVRAKTHPSIKYLQDFADGKYNHAVRRQSKMARPSRTALHRAASSLPRTTRAQLRKIPPASCRNAIRNVDQQTFSTLAHSSTPSCMGTATPQPEPSIKPPFLDYFQGEGMDENEFLTAGTVSALPPQNGIPGWMRMTMIKYFPRVDDDNDQRNDNTFGMTLPGKLVQPPQLAHTPAFDLNGIDTDAGIWAYEGIVLPGGEIMVGRWWSPDSEVALDENGFEIPVPGAGLGLDEGGRAATELYSGPFIFWCVDED